MKKIFLLLTVVVLSLTATAQIYDLTQIIYTDPPDSFAVERNTRNRYHIVNGSYVFQGESSIAQLTPFFWITGTPNSLSGYGITDAVSTGGSYSNPSWITSLAWSKITGAPGFLAINTVTSTASGARNFNQAYQVSSTKYVDIRVSASISNSLTLSGGSSGEVYLEYSADGSTGWALAGRAANASTGTVVVGISTTAIGGGQMGVILPPGYYWRLRTNNVSGTPTYTFTGGVEILYS